MDEEHSKQLTEREEERGRGQERREQIRQQAREQPKESENVGKDTKETVGTSRTEERFRWKRTN